MNRCNCKPLYLEHSARDVLELMPLECWWIIILWLARLCPITALATLRAVSRGLKAAVESANIHIDFSKPLYGGKSFYALTKHFRPFDEYPSMWYFHNEHSRTLNRFCQLKHRFGCFRDIKGLWSIPNILEESGMDPIILPRATEEFFALCKNKDKKIRMMKRFGVKLFAILMEWGHYGSAFRLIEMGVDPYHERRGKSVLSFLGHRGTPAQFLHMIRLVNADKDLLTEILFSAVSTQNTALVRHLVGDTRVSPLVVNKKGENLLHAFFRTSLRVNPSRELVDFLLSLGVPLSGSPGLESPFSLMLSNPGKREEGILDRCLRLIQQENILLPLNPADTLASYAANAASGGMDLGEWTDLEKLGILPTEEAFSNVLILTGPFYDPKITVELIRHFFSVNPDIDPDGKVNEATFLEYSLARGLCPELCTVLLEQGANPNLYFGDQAPVEISCERGNLSCLKLLIRYGASFSEEEGGVHYRTLVFAILRDSLEMCSVLLELGADPLQPARQGGLNALHFACSSECSLEMLELLISRCKPEYGRTIDEYIALSEQLNPLDRAVKGGQHSKATFLIKNRYFVVREATLRFAVESGEIEMLRLVCSHYETDDYLKATLHKLAKDLKFEELSEFLVQI